jgi:hypothetical protein
MSWDWDEIGVHLRNRWKPILLGSVGGEVPEQQFGDAVEHVTQVRLGIRAVEFGRAVQTID